MTYSILSENSGLAEIRHDCKTPIDFLSLVGSPRYCMITGSQGLYIPGSVSPFKPKKMFFLSEGGTDKDIFGDGFFYWFTEEMCNIKKSEDRYKKAFEYVKSGDNYKSQIVCSALILNDIRGTVLLQDAEIDTLMSADVLDIPEDDWIDDFKSVMEFIKYLMYTDKHYVSIEAAVHFIRHFKPDDRKMARLALANWHGMLYLSIPKKYSFPITEYVLDKLGLM